MSDNSSAQDYICGFVALVGRPNVGKSTLLNRIMGEHLAITTPKPQTTRQKIRGILTQDDSQLIFVDTPGIVPGKIPSTSEALQDFLLEEALEGLEDVDCVLFMIDAKSGFTYEDAAIWDLLFRQQTLTAKCIIVLNKIDKIEGGRESLLPLLQTLSEMTGMTDLVPVSGKTGDGIRDLVKKAKTFIPKGPALFPADQISDRNDRHIAAEVVRERLFFEMSEELPYSIAVETKNFHESEERIHIEADVYVERESQKGMVIGKQGRVLKKVGTDARKVLEDFFQKKIFLDLRVKVLRNWTRDESKLRQLGYEVKKSAKQGRS